MAITAEAILALPPAKRRELDTLLRGWTRLASRDDLADWLRTQLGVTLPRTACCREHTAPLDAVWEAYNARAPLTVWVGSRGFGGKSFALAALAMAEAATLRAEVRVLGGSVDQSENVVRYTANWVGRPQVMRLLRGETMREAVTRSRIRLSGGGMVDALAASTRAVRGPHPTRLRVDEADELALGTLDAALGQTMAKSGVAAQTIISSTHHYPDGTMTEVLRRAKDRGWPIRMWCYKCTSIDNGGWLDPAEIARKRQEVPAAMWAAEYDLQEPAPESRAFMSDAVEAMFDRGLGEYHGSAGEVVEAEEPEEGARYATGADWAKERDWTVIVTLRVDVKPARVVAFQRFQRYPSPVMVERFEAQLKRYKGAAAHDQTGIGNMIDGYLTVPADGVVLSGRTRTDLLTKYIAAVETGEIVSPMIDYAYGEHKFCSVDDLFGNGHLPDSVCALALAWSTQAGGEVKMWWL